MKYKYWVNIGSVGALECEDLFELIMVRNAKTFKPGPCDIGPFNDVEEAIHFLEDEDSSYAISFSAEKS